MNLKSNLLLTFKVLWGVAWLVSSALAQPPEPAQRVPERVAAREPVALPQMTVEELNRAIGGPTLVTVKIANATIAEAFDEVRKQSSIPIKAYLPTQWAAFKTTSPVNIVRQPLWLALRELQNIWNLRFESYVLRPGLSLMVYSDVRGDRIVSVGPCVFSISGVNYARSVSFSREGKSVPASDFSITGRAFIDPKVQVVRGSTYYQLDEAIDDKGLSLRRDEASTLLSAEANPIRFSLPLQPQAGMGRTLPRLKSMLGFVAVTRREVWEVPNVLQARDVVKTITRDGVEERFFVDGVRKEGEDYHVQITVSRPRSETRRIVQLGNKHNFVIIETNHYDQVRLVDAQNRDWPRYTYRIQTQGDRQTSIISTTVIFRKRPAGDGEVGTPVKLIVSVPTQWREVRVPFEFKDLPLP